MYRVLSFSALSFAIKFFVGFALTKLFAFFLGPSGLGVLGNLKNFTQLLSSFGSLGMQRGIIRFSSEWENQSQKMAALVGTLHVIFGVSTLMGGILLFLFSKSLSMMIFQGYDYVFLFKIAAVVLPMHGFHLLYFSLLQGLGNYKRVVGVEIAMSFTNLLVTAYLVYHFNLTGALIAVVTIPLLYFGLTFWKLSKFLKLFRFSWSTGIAKNLGLYTWMSLFSSLAIPLVYIMIRNRITLTLGADQAGYWEAVNQFSFFYFMILQSLILMYVLPNITANTSLSFYRNQVGGYFRKLMPLFLLFLVGLYFLRDVAIWLMLSDDFFPVRDLMGWRLMGDFFRASTLVLVAFFHARRKITSYIMIDLILSVSLLFLSYDFLDRFGLIGAVQAHFASYVLYFFTALFLLRKVLFYSIDE